MSAVEQPGENDESDEIAEDVAEGVDSAGDAAIAYAKSVQESVTQSAQEQPFLTVAAAFGVGAVLGGGVPNWAINLAGRAATRAAVAYALAQIAPTEE